MLDTPLGSSVVVHSLHPRASADREDFGTSDSVGLDEDDFACRDSAKAEASVDEPLVDDELHDFGPVRDGIREAGFVLFVFKLGVFFLQPLHPPDRHVRLHVELPFPTYQELDYSTISRRSCARSMMRSSSSFDVAWRSEPPAMLGATWSKSC